MATRLTVTVAALVAAAWLVTGTALAEEWKGKSETKTANGFQVELITSVDGLKVGENNIALQLKDATTGQPVLQKSTRIDYWMDETDTSMSHGGMTSQKPAVVNLNAAKDVPGRYEGKVSLSDAGAWKIRIFPDARGIRAPVSFDVRAGSSGPNWFALIAFAGLLLAAIAGVTFMVRKSQSSAPTPAIATPEASEA